MRAYIMRRLNTGCGMSESSARFHAILSAYLSIVAGLLEAVLSISLGSEEDSMSLYGIALMGFVDVTGSLLILNLFQCRRTSYAGERSQQDKRTEIIYTIAIGLLMVVLGVFLIVDSAISFIYHQTADEMNSLGIMIATFGAFSGLTLALYKYVVGKALNSSVVTAGKMQQYISNIKNCLSTCRLCEFIMCCSQQCSRFICCICWKSIMVG